jgi:hypothetical protein
MAPVPMSNDEINAMLARLGVNPDRLLSRRDTAELLQRMGVSLSERTLSKNAALRRPMPKYRVVAGRALTCPRDVVRFVLDSPIRSQSPMENAA